VLSVDVAGAGVAATGSVAAGAAAGGLFQLVVLVVVVRVVLDVSVALVAGTVAFGSALRLPSRLSGAPGGVNGPLSDIYFYSHVQLDAQGSVGLRHGLSVIVSGLNLNNEVFGFYQGSPQYMIQREYYQPTLSFGMRWSPSRE